HVPRFDGEAAAGRHGVARIHGEVEDDLIDLPRVGDDQPHTFAQMHGNFDVLPEQPAQHRFDVRHHTVEIDRLDFKDLLAAEGEELVRQGGAAASALLDQLDVAPRGVVRPEPVREMPTPADDHSQEVVEVVRDPAGQAPYGFHLL